MFVGMLSKITRKGCISSVISPKSSPFLQSNSSPLRLPSFTPHSTLLRSHLCRPNGVSGTIQNVGFPSSILAKRFFSNALLKRITEPIRNGRLMHSITSLNRGRRSFFGRFTTDGIVIPLIMMNVTVFMLWSLDQFMLQKILVYVENLPRGQLHTLITSVFSQIEPFMRQNFMVSVDNLTSGRLHTLITSAISHTEPFHLISNMIKLYYFGTFIEQSFGSRYFLKLYLGGAIAGSVFYLAYHAFMAGSFQSNPMGDLISLSKNPGPGASGAVNAIILLNAITWLDIFLYPVRTAFFYANIPTPAFLLGFIIIGHDVWRGDLQVSGSALLGGATAAALGWLRVRKSRARRF